MKKQNLNKNIHFRLDDFLDERKNKNSSKIEYKGVKYRSLSALIRGNKIKELTCTLVRIRIKRGESLERALTTPKSASEVRYISALSREYNGIAYPNLRSLIEANRHPSLTLSAVYTRLKSGWSIAEALNTPKLDTSKNLSMRG